MTTSSKSGRLLSAVATTVIVAVFASSAPAQNGGETEFEVERYYKETMRYIDDKGQTQSIDAEDLPEPPTPVVAHDPLNNMYTVADEDGRHYTLRRLDIRLSEGKKARPIVCVKTRVGKNETDDAVSMGIGDCD